MAPLGAILGWGVWPKDTTTVLFAAGSGQPDIPPETPSVQKYKSGWLFCPLHYVFSAKENNNKTVLAVGNSVNKINNNNFAFFFKVSTFKNLHFLSLWAGLSWTPSQSLLSHPKNRNVNKIRWVQYNIWRNIFVLRGESVKKTDTDGHCSKMLETLHLPRNISMQKTGKSSNKCEPDGSMFGCIFELAVACHT